MTPEEIKEARQINFKQTNAFAMQNGLILGIFSIIAQACFVMGLKTPFFSTIWLVMLINIPIFAFFLTAKFRREVAPNFPFSFSRGFTHTLLIVLYAGIWAGIATYIYLAFFDKGYIFDAYQASLSAPETAKAIADSGLEAQIKEMTGGLTLTQLIDEMRKVEPGHYAASIIYCYLLSSPIFAIIGGLFNIRRAKRNY